MYNMHIHTSFLKVFKKNLYVLLPLRQRKIFFLNTFRPIKYWVQNNLREMWTAITKIED